MTLKRIRRPPGKQGKRLDKTKASDMPKFQKKEDKETNVRDEAIGIY